MQQLHHVSRTYKDAITALNSLQTNSSVLAKLSRRPYGNRDAIPEVVKFSKAVGYEPSDFDRLNPIHIAGTKGKGSTSAFVSSILAQYSSRFTQCQNVGLYTSPHLRSVRERIKINNRPLAEDLFAKYFFSTWDRLEASERDGSGSNGSSSGVKPAYFRFLTLMCYHAFMKSDVESAVIETGIGGEYDSTNILVHPSVTAITSLGMDHVAVLGDTIERIAWHKAGIMKPGTPCFTVHQPDAALTGLVRRSQEKGVELRVVSEHPDLMEIELGLAGGFQKLNASLAIEVAAAHLRNIGARNLSTLPLPAEFRKGLEQVQLDGRYQTIEDGKVSWHLDGAHTMESISVAATWYASEAQLPRKKASKNVLIFNQQLRDALPLLVQLRKSLVRLMGREKVFDEVIFCSNVTFSNGKYKMDFLPASVDPEKSRDLTPQKEMAMTYSSLEKNYPEPAAIEVCGSIEEAIEHVRENSQSHSSGPINVFVTGSLHLVGGVLDVLDR